MRDSTNGMNVLNTTSISVLLLMCSLSWSAAPSACKNILVVTGFWPPTNNMLRQWSTSGEQNPNGWQGRNWENLGYDIYAYFPEFPPDGDPSNDAIGEPGSVGSPGSDLRVDYQDASRDFWRIMDAHKPRLLITTSRGGNIVWELEAREGGHEAWISDRHGVDVLPTEGSIDARSWQAIQRFRTRTLKSTLPMHHIRERLTSLDLLSAGDVVIDQGTSGNYLSGFVGLHGLYFQTLHPNTVAAGHIHVGRQVEDALARRLMQHTVRSVIEVFPPCQESPE